MAIRAPDGANNYRDNGQNTITKKYQQYDDEESPRVSDSWQGPSKKLNDLENSMKNCGEEAEKLRTDLQEAAWKTKYLPHLHTWTSQEHRPQGPPGPPTPPGRPGSSPLGTTQTSQDGALVLLVVCKRFSSPQVCCNRFKIDFVIIQEYISYCCSQEWYQFGAKPCCQENISDNVAKPCSTVTN